MFQELKHLYMHPDLRPESAAWKCTLGPFLSVENNFSFKGPYPLEDIGFMIYQLKLRRTQDAFRLTWNIPLENKSQ